jgi:hypothetical protein
MAQRMKASVATKNKDGSKTFWKEVGSAWVRDDGSMSVELFAMPAPQEGGFRFMLFHDDGERKPAAQSRGKADAPPIFDDDLPPY